MCVWEREREKCRQRREEWGTCVEDKKQEEKKKKKIEMIPESEMYEWKNKIKINIMFTIFS